MQNLVSMLLKLIENNFVCIKRDIKKESKGTGVSFKVLRRKQEDLSFSH